MPMFLVTSAWAAKSVALLTAPSTRYMMYRGTSEEVQVNKSTINIITIILKDQQQDLFHRLVILLSFTHFCFHHPNRYMLKITLL